MRKTILSLCLAFLATASWAAPAKKGLTRVIRLTDGTELTVELKGDEFLHYYQAADGKCYTDNGNGTFVPFDLETGKTNAMAKRTAMQQASQKMKAKPLRSMQQNAGPNKAFGDGTGYYGKKKGLIILVEFPNKKFKSGHDNEFYTKLANKENYVEGVFKGSVRDYYYAQSNGQFELTFDVIGPITAPENYNYYGQNTAGGSDAHVGTLVSWACNEVKDQVDFNDYDWDGDGYADQVFVLYAGPGENNTNNSDLIWPHMFYLSNSDIGQAVYINGVYVDTYACSCELNGYGTADGMGTICHEFSHCLGFPDAYDPTKTRFGMGTWDLMDVGSFIDNGFTPSCYTGLERMIAGWQNAKVLANDTIVNNMGPISEGGEFFIVYNEGYKNEFYILENHQNVGWDAKRKGTGLLVNYVDYDERVWTGMAPNANGDYARYTIICADGYNYDEYPDDNCFPYGSVNSLTDNSEPAATLNHANVNGKKLMGKPITDIHRNADGTMGFTFKREVELSNTPNPWDNLIVDGIAEVNAATQAKADNRIYTLDGRFLGTDVKALKSGMYIVNGKKILK